MKLKKYKFLADRTANGRVINGDTPPVGGNIPPKWLYVHEKYKKGDIVEGYLIGNILKIETNDAVFSDNKPFKGYITLETEVQSADTLWVAEVIGNPNTSIGQDKNQIMPNLKKMIAFSLLPIAVILIIRYIQKVEKW